MKKPYKHELACLADSYAEACAIDIGELQAALLSIPDTCYFVASGGALAVARVAADLFERRTGRLGRAITPLEFVDLAPRVRASAMLISASGRNPDAILAAAMAIENLDGRSLLLTHRARKDLPRQLQDARLAVIELPSRYGKDGFLATNSVLVMATALVRALADFETLPPTLPHLNTDLDYPELRPNCIILFPPHLSSVATDIEVRLNETGLATVQLADYRNFAHGRHLGFSRNLERISLLAISDSKMAELSQAILKELPDQTHVVGLRSQLDNPASILDLLAASMHLIVPTAARANVDPARPRVPSFGRTLYHLAPNRFLVAKANTALDKKLRAAGATTSSDEIAARYEEAFENWLSVMKTTSFGGVLFDYDGTCVTTEGRFDLPEPFIREQMERLLKAGFLIGFASGRGSSLHRDLREWIPKKYWDQIHVGLYNGGVQLKLSDQLEPQDDCSGDLKQAAELLKASVLHGQIVIEERTSQVGVTATRELPPELLRQLVLGTLSQRPGLEVKALASGHSVDIIPATSSKVAVLQTLDAVTDGAVIAIGDQGQFGGNDFELLAATPLSLSVDRCSADPTRCWNLETRRLSGPDLLDRYLRKLKPVRGSTAHRWRWS